MSNNISVKLFEQYTRHLTTDGRVLTAGGQGGVVGLPLLPSLAPGPGVDRPPLPAGEHALHQTSHTLQADTILSGLLFYFIVSVFYILFLSTILTVPMIFSTNKY